MGKKPIASVTYENERISIKDSLPYIKCVLTSLLCGPWADLWPSYGLYSKRFSLYWLGTPGKRPNGSIRDPSTENGRKFAPMAPVASKFRLGNRRQFCFPFVILLQDAFAGLAPRANQRPSIAATFPVWSHRQKHGLNSSLLLKGSDTALDSNYSHSGWDTVSCSR